MSGCLFAKSEATPNTPVGARKPYTSPTQWESNCVDCCAGVFPNWPDAATVLGAVNDAARRLWRWPSAIIDRTCARRPAGWQVGTKGWPLCDRTKGWRCHSGGFRLPVGAITQHGIEDDQQLAHAGDNDDLGLLAGQPVGKRRDHRVVSLGGQRGHVQRLADHGAAALDVALAAA